MPARLVPQVGMEAVVEEFATTTPALVVEVGEDGHRVVVECEGQRRTFTLRALTARYVEEPAPYYGTRLRLLGPSTQA